MSKSSLLRQDTPRTNCDNCGGILVGGKCPYCKAVWFKPGIQLGKHGIVKSVSIEANESFIDVTGWGDSEPKRIRGLLDYTVNLEIVGLRDEEVQQFYDLIMNNMGRSNHVTD